MEECGKNGLPCQNLMQKSTAKEARGAKKGVMWPHWQNGVRFVVLEAPWKHSKEHQSREGVTAAPRKVETLVTELFLVSGSGEVLVSENCLPFAHPPQNTLI